MNQYKNSQFKIIVEVEIKNRKTSNFRGFLISKNACCHLLFILRLIKIMYAKITNFVNFLLE